MNLVQKSGKRSLIFIQEAGLHDDKNGWKSQGFLQQQKLWLGNICAAKCAWFCIAAPTKCGFAASIIWTLWKESDLKAFEKPLHFWWHCWVFMAYNYPQRLFFLLTNLGWQFSLWWRRILYASTGSTAVRTTFHATVYKQEICPAEWKFCNVQIEAFWTML